MLHFICSNGAYESQKGLVGKIEKKWKILYSFLFQLVVWFAALHCWLNELRVVKKNKSIIILNFDGHRNKFCEFLGNFAPKV
jgi:hypothetical protein